MGYWLAIKKNAHLNWARNSAPLNITRYVNASVNYVEESLDADHYVVSVRAVSNAGIGARAEKYYHLRFSSKGFSDHLFSIAISCVSIGCTLIIVSAIIWSNIKAKREAKRIDGVETFTNMNLNTSDTRADYIPAEIESRMRKAYKKKKLFLRSQNSELFSAVHQRVRGVGVLLNNPLYGLHERRERFLLEKVEECLGSGAFGQVYKAIVRIDGKKEVLALKMPNKNLPPEERKAFRQEIEFLKRVGSHPNIVGLRGFCLEENNASMLIEYCPFGDLKTYLDRIRNELESASLSETKMTSFAWQISSGMEYLAERRLVHRDLAARNILLESDAKVKITDFGLSRDIYTEGLYYKRSAGKLPFRWMALESFSRAEYSEKSDVWSFGVLMWEIATFGEQPFGALPPDVVIEQLRQGVRLHQPETCSIELYEIMKACWHESPDGRPTFSQLKQQLDALLVQTQEYFSFDG